MRKLAALLVMFGTVLNQIDAAYCTSPLCPCQSAFRIFGGIEPSLYTYRQKTEVNNIVSISAAQLTLLPPAPTLVLVDDLIIQGESKRAPDFKDQFTIPWTVGVELSYALSCNSEIFMDANYINACGKSDSFTVNYPAIAGPGSPPLPTLVPAQTIRIDEDYTDLEGFGGHIGLRYYSPRLCGTSLFFGVKAGIRHWNSVYSHTSFQNNDEPEVDLGRVSYFPSHTVASGGFQLGLDISITNCLSAVIMGEAVATGTFKHGKDTFAEALEASNTFTIPPFVIARSFISVIDIPVRRRGTILTFPVTVGIRTTF